MQPENLKFLQDRLFYLGTEQKLFPELKKQMAEGKPEFSLPLSNTYGNDTLSLNFHFRKSDTTEMYFLNRFDATLQKPGGNEISRSFKLENGKGVTAKEAYNLLDGRAVNKDLKNKEGISYNAWVKLDFANKDEAGQARILQYHKNYGYDLQAELSKLPMANLPGDGMTKLMASLEKGNVHTVKLADFPSHPTILVAANPQYKSLDLADETGRYLSKETRQAIYKAGEKQLNQPLVTKPTVEEKQKQKNPSVEKKVAVAVAKEPKMTHKAPQKKTMQEKIAALMPKKHATAPKKGLSR
jgi:hypothetical protein